ncbi:unnamed protein product [Brassica oleracea]
MRAGKRGYELVHQPFILKTCNVTPMVDESPCEIGIYGKFREFFLKCVDAGNIDAVYNEGLHRSTCSGVAEGIKVLEENVKILKPPMCFEQVAANHVDLNSDAISEMGYEL